MTVVVLLSGILLALVVQLSCSTANQASALQAGDDCCTECPLEREGKTCPPGCPNCRCAHGVSVAALPATSAFEAAAPAPEASASVFETDVFTVPVPVVFGIYRPPRAHAAA